MSAVPSSSHHTQDITTSTFVTMYHLASTILLEKAEQMGVDRQCAEDIVQDVLLQAWQEGNFESRPDVLLTQLENVVGARCQRVMEEDALLEYSGVHKEDIVAWPVIEQAVTVDADSASSAVAEVLQRLPVKYRRVLELRILEGKTGNETARELQVSHWVMHKQFGAALRAMKRLLRESAQVEEWFTSMSLNPVC